MASANTLPLAVDRALRVGFFRVDDPGASGMISFHSKGFAIVHVVTAGAESRALPAAGGYAVGTRILVVFVTDGGDLTITGAASNVVLDSAGDFAEFLLTDNNGTKVWRLVSSTTGVEQEATVVTRTAAAASADLIPVSGGADRSIKAATAVALGTVDINTGDAATDAAIIDLADALAAFGLVTHTWT